MNHIPYYTYPMRTFTFYFMIVLDAIYHTFSIVIFSKLLKLPSCIHTLFQQFFHPFSSFFFVPFSYFFLYAIEKSRSHKHIKSSMAVIKNIHNFCMIFFFFFTFMKPINSHRKNPQKISLCTRKNEPRKKVPCFHFRRFPCRICVENFGVGDW